MKKNNSIYLFTLFLFSTFSLAQENTKPVPAFDFLINYQNVRDIAISKNQDEIYFTIQSPDEQVSKIAFVTKVKNKWSKSQLVSFSSKHRDIEPFLSQDGLRLYFASNQPLNDSISKSKDYDIWYVERKKSKEKWSKPINLGLPINSEYDEFYPSIASNGNLYFTSENPKSLGKDDIYVAYWENNQYSEPENISKNINTEGYEFNAFISPDEQFILFTGYGRTDGFGSGDLYVSYKDEEGNWDTAKNLGISVNSKAMDYCPFYDASTKTLYFTSKRNSVTSISFDNIERFINEISKYENGFSRIYKHKIEL
jgi:hypothetical protein